MKIAEIGYVDDHFVVKCPFHDNHRAKMIPDRKWSKNLKAWTVSISGSNIRYLTKNYTEDEFTSTALRKIGEFKDKAKWIKNEYFPGWYDFKTKPMKHQTDALNRAWGKSQYALFHEMGCGKTFTAISLMTAYAIEGKIDSLVVICPTAIKHVWPWEIKKHSPIADNSMVYVMKPGAKGFKNFLHNKENKFKILVVGVESLSRGAAFKHVERFMSAHKAGCVLDESSKIKNWKSSRTKSAIFLGGYAPVRLILTGTPVTQGIHDLYAQFRFLDWDILGHKSYYSFQARYCVMGGFENRQIVGYNNIAELLSLVAPYSHTVTKDEALDLPPKVYEQMLIEPTKEQLSALRSLKDEMMADNNGDIIQVKTALDRLMRFNQICGGMFPYEHDLGAEQREFRIKPLPGKNPKMEELMNVIEGLPQDASVIIWSRFVPEINMIYEELESRWPGSAVRYYGATSGEERERINSDFQDKKIRFFISNPATGGMGLTLTAATYVIYYSNSYSFQDRMQSEDRAHRKGQTNRVTYIDLVLDVKAEREIIKALSNKQDVASLVRTNLKSGTFDNMLEA